MTDFPSDDVTQSAPAPKKNRGRPRTQKNDSQPAQGLSKEDTTLKAKPARKSTAKAVLAAEGEQSQQEAADAGQSNAAKAPERKKRGRPAGSKNARQAVEKQATDSDSQAPSTPQGDAVKDAAPRRRGRPAKKKSKEQLDLVTQSTSVAPVKDAQSSPPTQEIEETNTSTALQAQDSEEKTSSKPARKRSRKSRKSRKPIEANPQELVVAVPEVGLFAPASMVALMREDLSLPEISTRREPAVRDIQPPMLIEEAGLPATIEEDAAKDTKNTDGNTRRRTRRGGRRKSKAVSDESVTPDEAEPKSAPIALGHIPQLFADSVEDADDEDANPVEGIGGTIVTEKTPEAPERSKSSRTRARRRASAARKAAKQEEAQKEAKDKLGRQMLIGVQKDAQVEVVLTEEGIVQEYYVEMMHQTKIRGNIYKGIINNIDANLQAAFVNFGQAKNGFLQIDEVHPEYWLTPHEHVKGQKYPPIQKALKVGQEVLVQVVKEPTGNKGAFLTTWVSLAGRFLVLTPGQEQIGISRKVEDGEERNRLRELIKGIDPGAGLGAIVRTVSAGTSKTTLQKDLNFLKRVWKGIRKQATQDKAPCLIYQEPGLATRAVRDYLSEDVSTIWVNDEATAQSINDMASLLFPRKGGEAKPVSVYEEREKTLWEHFSIQTQLDEVHAREVLLPSGGRLVFDQTEALMAIDINSGKTSGKSNFSSMAHRTNMEAAVVIAKQLRLRDIGGQIVIDFIEMRESKHIHEVEKTLRNAMKSDRARHDVGRISSFGLLEIVRQRTGSSAISITQEPCPYCNGTGMRRNMEWQALYGLREIKRALRQAAENNQAKYTHATTADLGMFLLNAKREQLTLLEKEFGVQLEIRIAGA